MHKKWGSSTIILSVADVIQTTPAVNPFQQSTRSVYAGANVHIKELTIQSSCTITISGQGYWVEPKIWYTNLLHHSSICRYTNLLQHHSWACKLRGQGMAYVYKFGTTPLMGSRLAQRCNEIGQTPVHTQIWYSTTQGHVSRGARAACVPNEHRLDLVWFNGDIQELEHLTLPGGKTHYIKDIVNTISYMGM